MCCSPKPLIGTNPFPAILVLIFAVFTSVGTGNCQDSSTTNSKPVSADEHLEVIKIAPQASGKTLRKISIEPSAGNIVRAISEKGESLDLSFNADASNKFLNLPAEATWPTEVELLTAENSVQLSDGTIILSALDAKIVGTVARLESHPGNHRIGFWSNEKDYVEWIYQPTRWGKYDVKLVYSLSGPGGNRVHLSIDPEDDQKNAQESCKLEVDLPSTGSWYRYTTIDMGTHYFTDAIYRQPHRFRVSCDKKVGGAVMNLKAILLQPTSEGDQPVLPVDDSGELHFESHDATVIGTRLVYEPNPKKRTLGWWSNEKDRARWDFEISENGNYEVEILQGCGKGQGGSVVAIDILPANSSTSLRSSAQVVNSIEFEVVDTGHFQNFKQRIVGELELGKGDYTLQVRPIKKAANAIMDLRQLKLRKK